MSRLADAESKLAAALEALETAITTSGKDSAASNGMPDSAMIISEIGRIDAQLAQAMERIEALGKDIEEVLQSLIGSVGQIGEARLLAMAALILADRAQETSKSGTNGGGGGAAASEDAAADALERAADRIVELASKLSSN
jgi:cell division protein ZapA